MSLVKSYAVPLLALAFMVAGVTNANAQAPTPQSIDDPPPLEPHPTFTGVWRWHKPGFNFKDYDKLLVDPPSFFIHDESEEKGIKPEQLQVTGGAYRSHIINALEPTYAVVNKPGPGVLLLLSSITNLKLKKEERVMRGVFGFLPIGLAINAAQEAAGRALELNDAMFEVELLDSVTLERVVVAVDPEVVARAGEKPSWELLNEVFEAYAKEIRMRFDEARRN